MGTLVQHGVSDPKPNNINNLGGAGGTQHLRVAFPAATSVGNIVVAFGVIAALTGKTVTGAFDSTGSNTYTLISATHLNNSTSGLDSAIITSAPLTAAIPAGFCGRVSASTTTTATCTDLAGNSPGWTTNQWAGATFQEYSTGLPITVASNTANVITFSSAITAPGVGNPFSVGGYVGINFSAFDDYTAGYIGEYSGVSSTVGGNGTQGSFGAAATITSPGVTLASGTGVVVGFCSNDGTTAGNNPWDPLAGSGFTDDGQCFEWDLGTNTTGSAGATRVEHKSVSAGSITAVFTSRNADHFQAAHVVLQDSGTAAPQPPEDPWNWMHEETSDDEIQLIVDDDDDAISTNAAALQRFNFFDEWGRKEETVDDDWYVDEYTNTSVVSQPYVAQEEWQEEIVDDDWYVDEYTNTNAIVNQPYLAQEEWQEEYVEDEWLVEEYANIDAGVPTYEEWQEEYVEDEWLVEEYANIDAGVPTYEEWQEEYVEDEWYVDEYTNTNPYTAQEEWQEEYVEDEWFVEEYANIDAVVNQPYIVQEEWQEEYVEDEWLVEEYANIDAGVPTYEEWQEEVVDDDWYVDEYTNTNAVVINQPYVAQEEWQEETVDDDWQFDEYSNVDAGVPTYEEWQEEYVEDEWLVEEYANIDAVTALPFTDQEAFDWGSDVAVEDFFTNHYSAQDADVIVSEQWEEEYVDDDWYVDEYTNTNAVVNQPYVAQEEWQEEYVDDELVLDDYALVDTPYIVQEEWLDEYVDDELVLDEFINTTISTQPTDTEWEDELVEDDWQSWLEISVVPAIISPAQHFGDLAEHLEEWMLIEDDYDWYNSVNLVIKARPTRITISQACDTITIRQQLDTLVFKQQQDTVTFIGGS